MKNRADVMDDADVAVDGVWGEPPDPATTPEGRRRSRVERGDYRAVLARFDDPRFDLTERERIWSDAFEALGAAARKDPAAFGLDQLDEMITFVAFLRQRTETSLRQRLRAHDRAIGMQGAGPDPAIEDPILEKLLDLFDRQAKLIEARATVERRTTLARRPGPAGKPGGTSNDA